MSGDFHSGVEEVKLLDSDYETQTNVDDETYQPTLDRPDVKSLYCELCNIKVTSGKILQRHLEGKKHKRRVEREGKSFICEICEICANSSTQLNIHLSSSKHKNRLLKKDGHDGRRFSTGLYIILFCVFCIFLNLLMLFKVVNI